MAWANCVQCHHRKFWKASRGSSLKELKCEKCGGDLRAGDLVRRVRVEIVNYDKFEGGKWVREIGSGYKTFLSLKIDPAPAPDEVQIDGYVLYIGYFSVRKIEQGEDWVVLYKGRNCSERVVVRRSEFDRIKSNA